MPVKSVNTSYAQEDLDLINSKIMNIDRADSPSLNDSCGETCNSRPESSADSLNQSEIPDDIENEGKIDIKEDKDDSSINDVSDTKNEEPSTECPSISQIIESIDLPTDKLPQTKSVKEKLKDERSSNSSNQKLKNSQKLVTRGGLKFSPGTKLEAKDFSDKWYVARVVETDWTEREVLIHFDKWNSRFDEWIPMDSSRLRVPQMEPRDLKMREFEAGERILATWVDGRKYPAKVNAVLGNDRYDVLFDDGYTKVVRSSKMTKIAGTSEKKEMSMEADSYIGSKQERRDKSRKHSVMDLFSRKKAKPEGEKPSKKEESIDGSESLPLDSTEADTGACYDSGAEVLKGFENTKAKPKSFSKRKRESSKHDTDLEEDVGPEWIDGEPQGIESFTIDGNDGARRSIIVSDKRLPPGWQKHFTQRRTGNSAGKWDVLFVHEDTGKKFRSKSDIRTFFESHKEVDFDPEMFDFCIHRRKRSRCPKPKPETPAESPKKIKTLLPKAKPAPASTENIVVPTSSANTPVPITPTITTVDDSAVYIGSLRVEMEDSAYKCPKEGCAKTFRKENLLQMHIKHYHPEYSKYLGSTPNVADLAYARTTGESVLDVTPKSRISEKRKSLQEKIVKTSFANSPGHLTPTLSSSISTASVDGDISEHANQLRDDGHLKFEMMSPVSSNSLDNDEDICKRTDANCAMSPGRLFDMKIKDEKNQVGIKTLLPVRHSNSTDIQRIDRSKSLDDTDHIEKVKGQRKRQLSEYSSDASTKSKKPQGLNDLTDDYGDLDDSALDAEGPAGPVYRFSRRKSDPKSDENSQSSQLNNFLLEKCDPTKRNNNESNVDEDGECVMMVINGELVKVEQLRREEIINCTCGLMEEDGLMIQCDLCLCWQHGHCNAIEREKDVPEKYICYICRHPYRQRFSMKYIHDQDWIKEGKLQCLTKRTKNQSLINERTAMLKRSYDLISALLQIQQILHSLRVKITIAQTKDHPKLYLWAKNWEKLEIQEPNLEPVPVLEIIKSEPEPEEITTDFPIEEEQKVEIKMEVEDDPHGKSIATNSELMKILEEDGTMSDESKVKCKKEDSTTESEGHILLDILTKSETDKKLQNFHNKLEDKVLKNSGEMNPDSNDEKLIVEDTNIKTEPDMLSHETVKTIQPFIPEPEAAIDPAECRLRLLEHIAHFQSHLDSQLTMVEAQVSFLETMDPDNIGSSSDVEPRTKQTLQMLMRDLSIVRKLATLC